MATSQMEIAGTIAVPRKFRNAPSCGSPADARSQMGVSKTTAAVFSSIGGPSFAGSERLVAQGHGPGGASEQNGGGCFLDRDQFHSRLSVTADHDGTLLALHLLNQTEALGFELGDGHLHKMTMV